MRDHDLFDLDTLGEARGYQQWMLASIAASLGSHVLEVGAGSGNLSRWLAARGGTLELLEPDPALRRKLRGRAAGFKARTRIHAGGLPLSPAAWAAKPIDTIVHANVLEHVADDRRAFDSMARLLDRSPARGPRRLVSVVPAHRFAYGSLDAAEGHFRRYSASALEELARPWAGRARHRLRAFNPLGLAGWLISGRVLRRPRVEASAVKAVETLLPLFKAADACLAKGLGLRLGQSFISVLEWPARRP